MKAFLKNQYSITFIRCLYGQLFVSLVSFPILVSWGIPISPLCLISTPLFTPLLAIFLIVSSIVFICVLFHIPHDIPMQLLEKISFLWAICLEWQHHIPLIGFRQPHWLILIACPLFAIYITLTKTTLLKKLLWLFLFSSGLVFLLKYQLQEDIQTNIPYQKKAIELISQNQTLIIVDPGVIGSRPSATSWICFDMIPFLIKKTGATSIDHLVICKINQRTFEATTAAFSKIEIKRIYLPSFKGQMTKKCWRAYFILQETAQAAGCSIIKVHSSKAQTALIGTNKFVFSKQKISTYQDAKFHELEVGTESEKALD